MSDVSFLAGGYCAIAKLAELFPCTMLASFDFVSLLQIICGSATIYMNVPNGVSSTFSMGTSSISVDQYWDSERSKQFCSKALALVIATLCI